MAPRSDTANPVSVVIPTQGMRPDILGVTIERLSEEPCVGQIIVVGNSAIDGSLARHDRETVSFVASRGGGPNSCRQAGLEVASEEVVLFLDDDVLPEDGLAAAHSAHHTRTQGLVVVGYMPVDRGANGRYATATAELYGLEYERRVTGYDDAPGSILRNLWGGNVSLSRRDALRVGVENKAHPGRRHEDQDFGIRCAAAGLEGLFDRELRATHLYRRSRGAFLRDAWAQGYERTVLRQNEPLSEWFVRGAGSAADSYGKNRTDGALRGAELISLKAARRLQLWRGSRRAHRETDRLEGHPWQHRS
jgi:glycosyltransferase involved in cell wall biosynthesis